MPIFIICSLLLGFLVKSRSVYLPLLLNDVVWMASGCLAAVFLLAGCFKKLSTTVWHDGFACGVLWAWYGYWQPLFNNDAPMFYLFPAYYTLLCTWMFLAVVNRSARFDRESRESLIYLQHHLTRFNTRIIGGLVIVSLMLQEHYLLYPIAMTLFIIRYSLQRCLEIVEERVG